MNDGKITMISIIMNKYVNKYLNAHVINYYDLFQIDRTSTLEEIKKGIKKLKTILHPDLKAYLPEFMQKYYSEILEEFRNCENAFSNEKSKCLYDQALQKERTINNSINDSKQSKKSDITEFEFDSVLAAIKITTKRHGFAFTLNSITDTFLDQSISSWENRFSRETRSNLTKIGKQRFKEVIRKISKEETSIQENIIAWLSYLYKNDEEIKVLMYPLENACYQTLLKYNEKTLNFALQKYFNEKNAAYFTRENDSRKLLKNNIKANELPLYMLIYLDSYKDEELIYSYEKLSKLEIERLIPTFTKKIIEELRQKNKYNK